MNGLASYIKQAEESTDYQVGDAFDIEFGETQLIETTIVEILEDGIVIQMDSVGLDLMIENNLRLEEKSLSDYDADQEEHFGEGYKVMPPMSDKYQPRDGLEGPFTTLSGKVVYYDQREGSYYDPDTDIYMSYDEFQNYDKDYSKMRNDEDMGSDADEIRLKTASTLDAQEGPVDEAGCSSSRLKELAGLPETTIKDRDAYDASEQGDKKKITLPKAPWEKDKEVNEAEEKPYICVHAKKGKHECHAPTSYEAAKKAAAHWKLKSTAGIDAHLAIDEAEYQGRKVKLNKPMAGDVKKSKVYVKDPKTGNVKKVNFGHGGTSAKKAGQKTMKIKKNNPARRKSFRARHNCDNPGPKTKARYWSCRAW